eukprot:gb/GECG01015903.1/.p1 GENE.gb/GECG01015903.1/~~gb/GECG01015903.1/.p1  ORF type:complete len:367 (+),score=32.79 gb/GECG01015903.1/:1-1101(+)
MADNTNSNPGAGGANWFERFQQTSPFVTRTTLMVFLSCSIFGYVTGLYLYFLNCTEMTLAHFQIWRPFTCLFFEDSILGLVFSILMFYPQAKQLETSMNSTRFLALMALFHGLTQIGFMIFMVLLAFNPIAPSLSFLGKCSMGLWPTVMAMLGMDAARRPDEVKRLLFFPCPLQNRYFPWIFIGLFSLLGGIQYHLIVATIVGYMYGWEWLESLEPSESRLQGWESTALTSVIQQPYYISVSYGGGPGLDGGEASHGGSVRPGDNARDNGNSTSFLFGGNGSTQGQASSGQQQQSPFPGRGKTLASQTEGGMDSQANRTQANDSQTRREALRKAAEARQQSRARNESPQQQRGRSEDDGDQDLLGV